MKTIGLFGAAFDPLHLGHLLIGRVALSEKSPATPTEPLIDAVQLMPSPERWDKKPLAPDELRFRWAELASRYEQRNGWNVFASDFELKLGRFRGTYQLLQQLRAHNPGTTYKLILGQDSFESLPLWRDSETQILNGLNIAAEFSLLVVPRGTVAGEPAQPELPEWAIPFSKTITFLPTLASCPSLAADLGDAREISLLASSDIRKRLKEKSNVHYSLAEIEQSIAENRLYR